MNVPELVFRASTQALHAAKTKLDQVRTSTEKAAASTKDLKGGLDALGNVGGPIGNVVGQARDLGDQLTSVAGAARAAPPLLLAAASAAGILAAVRFAPILDDLSDMARLLGINADRLATLDLKLANFGGAKAYQADLDRIAKALSRADEEGSRAAKAFEYLGVNVDKTASAQDAASQLAEQYADRAQAGNLTLDEQQALLLALGTGYREVLIRQQEALEAKKLENEFNERGISISQEGIAAANAYGDATDKLTYAFQTMGSELVGKLVPGFTALIEAFVNSYKNGGLVAGLFTALTTTANVLMVPVRVLTNLFVALDVVVQSLGKSIGAVLAAIATRSMEPLKELRKDIGQLLADADKIVQNNPLWGGASTAAPVAPNLLPPPKRGKFVADNTPPPKKEDDPNAEINRLIDSLTKQALAQDNLNKYDLIAIELQNKKYAKASESLKQEALAAALKIDTANANKILNESTASLTGIATSYVNKLLDEQLQLQMNKRDYDAMLANRQIDIQLQRDLNALKEKGLWNLEREQQLIAAANNARNQVSVGTEQAKKSDEDAATFTSGWKKAFEEYQKKATDSAAIGAEAFQSAQGLITGAIENFIMTGKLGFKEFLAGFLKMIAGILAKWAALNILSMAFGGGPIPLSAMFKFAKGGAFDNGVQKFAKGGAFTNSVVNKPTAFPMGLMGEAGPEAIMPLRRDSSGRLGVAAAGGSGGVQIGTVSIVVQGGNTNEETASTLNKELLKTMAQVADSRIANARRPGGLSNAF